MKMKPLKQAKCFRASVIFAAVVVSLSFGNVQAKAKASGDLDGDGIPNIVDPDVDNDGVPNGRDRNVDGGIAQSGPFKGRYIGDHLKNNAAKEKDIDGDGLADESLGETDIDGDGKKDDAAKETDIDGDGKADNSPTETDIDGDGKADDADNELDIDGDGRADDSLTETDIDGDGKANGASNEFDIDGDGNFNFVDNDGNGNGVPDAHEGAFSAGSVTITSSWGSSMIITGLPELAHISFGIFPQTPVGATEPPPIPESSAAINNSSGWGGAVLQVWNWSGGGWNSWPNFGDPALPPYQFNLVSLDGSAFIGGGELVPVGYSATPPTIP